MSFTPIEYGKVSNGKLVIQTSEYYWNFQVKGTFPKYVKPDIKKPTVETWLDPNKKPGPGGKQGSGKANYGSRLSSNPKHK